MLELYTNIKRYRQLNMLTQEDLAKKVGYADKGMISRVENGKIDLSQSQIIKFAEALNVSPGVLMGIDTNSNEDKSAASSAAALNIKGYSEKEKRFIDVYLNLSPEDQDLLETMLYRIAPEKKSDSGD